MIQLCMEAVSPYAGGRCANTCLRIALFVPYKIMIPLSPLMSRANRQNLPENETRNLSPQGGGRFRVF
ncbi:hypothetical protein A7X67_07620 [Clostridium sp. W14A]|nr:hypothetical protein A7X67_07620 [Clostridium sp. W14A]